MKKTIFAILALCLALVTAFLMPAQAVGANVGAGDEFLKEVRIGYGEEGKAKLEAEGYTVWQELDANKDGTGSSVYLGYITTTVKEEAITDFAVMPMGSDGKQAYSFKAYKEEMNSLSKQIDEMVSSFESAILEFRANYMKGAPYNDYALRAYKLLEMYTEDDTGRTLADLFINGTEADKATYHNILMMGNSVAVAAVKIALAIGCTETGGETFLDRLSTATKKDINQEDNEKVNALANLIAAFKEEINLALVTYNTAQAYDGGKEKFVSDLIEQEGDYRTAISHISLIDTMKNTNYGTLTVDEKPLSFLDAMLLPTTAQNKDDLALDDNLLYMLVSSMTEGQIEIAKYVGISTLISYACSTRTEKVKGADEILHFDLSKVDSALEELIQTEKISVYLGVDRSVFSDYKTVAITDEAIRSSTLNKNFGTNSNYNDSSSNAAKIALITLSAVTGAASIGLGIYSYLNWNDIVTPKEVVLNPYIPPKVTYYWPENPDVIVEFVGEPSQFKQQLNSGEICNPLTGKSDACLDEYFMAEEADIDYQNSYSTSMSTKITMVAGVVCLVASIVLGVLAYLKKNQTPAPQKVDYTQIPRAIIDVKRNSYTADQYFVYYAAKSVNLPAGYEAKEESTVLYGDLNGLNEIEPWLCLYYAKDMRIGSPITADIYLSGDGTIPALKKNKYVPIHDFFNKDLIMNNKAYAAYNLNGTSEKKDTPGVYVYFKRNLSYQLQTATVVDDIDFNWLAVVTFVAGAVLAGAAVWLIAKKKYKRKAEETV